MGIQATTYRQIERLQKELPEVLVMLPSGKVVTGRTKYASPACALVYAMDERGEELWRSVFWRDLAHRYLNKRPIIF
jgi:hypothetical protein